jgi:hypothetical protein
MTFLRGIFGKKKPGEDAPAVNPQSTQVVPANALSMITIYDD